MDLPDEKIFFLIELIQSYPHIYDLSNKDYKNVIKKEESWGEIALVLNISIDDCKKIWKNLRDKFTRDKRQPSGSKALEKWIFYDKMIFYSKYTRPRKTHTATSKEETDTIVETVEIGESENATWSSIDSIIIENSTTSSNETIVENSKVQQKKRKKTDDDNDIQEVLKCAKGILNKVQSNTQTNDPNRMFVEYIYALLSEMNADAAKIKRRQILSLMDDD